MPKFSKPVWYFVGFSSLQSRTELVNLRHSSQTMTFSTETNRDCRYAPSLAAFLFYWRRVRQKRVSTKVMIDFHKVHVGQIPIGRTLERQVYRRSILPGH